MIILKSQNSYKSQAMYYSRLAFIINFSLPDAKKVLTLLSIFNPVFYFSYVLYLDGNCITAV